MNRAALFLLNVYLYTVFLLLSLVVIPGLTLVVAVQAPFRPHRRSMRLFRRCISWYGRAITGAGYPFIRIRFEDHGGTDKMGPAIYVCNHRSASDPFLMCVLPHEVVQIVNIWPFRIPVIGLYARFAGYLNIRMMTPEDFMARAGALLSEGASVIFFPEGTRSATGKMGAFHGAAFRLALDTKAAVVPLCISGNDAIPPKGSLVLHPGTIRVRRLPAITWDEYRDLTAFAFKNRVWKIIDRELAGMENRA